MLQTFATLIGFYVLCFVIFLFPVGLVASAEPRPRWEWKNRMFKHTAQIALGLTIAVAIMMEV